MRALADRSDALLNRRSSFVFDEFNSYTDGALFTKGGTSATIAMAGSGDKLSIQNTGAANGEAWVATTNPLFVLANGKPIHVEYRINYQEADGTNLYASLFAGLAGSFATGILVNGTGLPKTSTQTMVGLTKGPGQSVWSLVAQVGTTQLLQASSNSCISTGDQILEIDITPISASLAEVTAKVNNVPLMYPTTQGQGAAPREVKLQWTITSALACYAGLFLKEITGTNQETVLWDYFGASKLRGVPGNG